MKPKESTADNNYVIKLNTDRARAAHVLMRTIIDEKGQPEAGTSSSKEAEPISEKDQ